MTVTLHITPEIEAVLIAQADARGLAIENYLLNLVEQFTLSAKGEKPLDGRAEAVARMIAFGDRYRLNLGEPITRALLHEGHRF